MPLRDDFNKVLEELETLEEVKVNRDELECWFIYDLKAASQAKERRKRKAAAAATDNDSNAGRDEAAPTGRVGQLAG